MHDISTQQHYTLYSLIKQTVGKQTTQIKNARNYWHKLKKKNEEKNEEKIC